MVRSMPFDASRHRAADTDVLEDLVVVLFRGLGFALRRAVTVSKWAALFPMLSAPAAVCFWLLAYRDWQDALAFALISCGLLLVWRFGAPTSFRRAVTLRIRARWRTWKVYSRNWPSVCALHGLTQNLDGLPVTPRLRRTFIGDTTDELLITMIAGQTVSDWSSRSEALAHTFGALSASVRLEAPACIRVTLRRVDRLARAVALPRPSQAVVLDALPIGIADDGSPWRIRIFGRHLLVAGATGSGKGSILWSILAGVAPLISSGVVEAWVIDPKGGMEFGAGSRIFSRFAFDASGATLTLLRDAVTILEGRADRLRGVARQHIPTRDEPLILLVVDELASLTAYQTDRKIAAEMNQLLGLILSQGRAVGINVVAAVQDPSKDTVALRQLFPTRIGLRLAEASQVDMVLGAGARNAGALCDQIPDGLPGVAYVMEDGRAVPHRVRAFRVTDEDIDALGDRYAPIPSNGEAEQ